MTVASLPEILRCSRCPKISEVLLAVSRHSPSSQLRSKILWIGKSLLKMKLRQYSILRDRIKMREIDLLALLVGELRPQDEGPVVEPLADDGRAQLVCGRLQRLNVIDSEKGVVVLAKGDVCTIELLLY